MANKWMDRLRKMEGAVIGDYNPFAHGIRSHSPSLNFTFGRSHMLPQGYTVVVYGPPKAGKSIVAKDFIGCLHQADESALAIKFDTEFREEGQNTELKDPKNVWGVDPSRYIAYSANAPEMVFDRIEKEIGPMCDDGAPIKLIIIDSLNGIQGRRMQNAESILNMQIGDLAQTLQDGLKRILPIQRKHRLAFILTAHVRAEMDLGEQMRGNKVKMGASYGVQHHAEYFMYVEQNRSTAGRADILGHKFENEERTDLMDKAEKTAHKIRCVMKANSVALAGRTGEFTLDYQRGIINQHEEVFLLGINQGIINRPNNTTYEFAGKTFRGKPAMVEALRADTDMQQAILKELRERDMNGTLIEDVRRETLQEEEKAA